jgi:hypothetical protein
LQPTSWDMDLDMIGTNGLQFNNKNKDQDFTLMIRISAESGSLVTFGANLYYDIRQIRPTNCVKTGAWIDKDLAINIDEPGQILLAGIFKSKIYFCNNFQL